MTRLAPVLLLALVALASACQPSPVVAPAVSVPDVAAQDAASAPPSVVLQARLMSDVRALAADSMRGRAAGTPDAERARVYIEERFRGIGLDAVYGGSYRQPFPLQSGAEGINLVGRIEGRVYPQTVLVVTAHYDHLGVQKGQVFNGADDNASGVAALLEVARRFREAPPEHSVLFVAFDAEEQGLVGARRFVEAPPVPVGAMLATINFDMVSRGDAGALWVAGTTPYPHLGEILAPVVQRAPVTVRFGHDTGAGSDNWTSASDHGPFHARGVPFVYFGVEDHDDYHRATDDAEAIDPVFYAGAVEAIWSAVEALDQSHAALVTGR